MKASELRIGNYVMEKHYGLRKVIKIDSREGQDNVYRDAYGDAHGGFIRPIPLTEEWLLKFGFEVIGTYVNEGILVTDYGINITDCNNDEKLIVSDWNMNVSIGEYSEDDYYVCNFNYKHVHQLQNLYFALTGEELKIKKND